MIIAFNWECQAIRQKKRNNENNNNNNKSCVILLNEWHPEVKWEIFTVLTLHFYLHNRTAVHWNALNDWMCSFVTDTLPRWAVWGWLPTVTSASGAFTSDLVALHWCDILHVVTPTVLKFRNRWNRTDQRSRQHFHLVIFRCKIFTESSGFFVVFFHPASEAEHRRWLEGGKWHRRGFILRWM